MKSIRNYFNLATDKEKAIIEEFANANADNLGALIHFGTESYRVGFVRGATTVVGGLLLSGLVIFAVTGPEGFWYFKKNKKDSQPKKD